MGCVCLLDARQFPKVYETAVVVKKTDSGIRSAASEQEGSCKNRRDRADSKDSEGPSTGFAVAYDIIWHDGREVAAGDAKAKSGNRRTAVAHSNKDWKALFSLAGTGKTNENAPCHSLHYNRARTNKSNCLPFLASGLYRWPRSLTGSALFGSGRGLYRQWGIAPRPETNFLCRV